MGVLSNAFRNFSSATKDAFASAGEDYNVAIESRDLQAISKSRLISEARDIASSKYIDTDKGMFADFKNFGKGLKNMIFGKSGSSNKEDSMDSWTFDDIGFSGDGISGRSGITAEGMADNSMKMSHAIGGAIISGSNRSIRASSIMMGGLINEVRTGNSLLKGILDTMSDKTFREASLKYYSDSLLLLKNIELGVQMQAVESGKKDEEAFKPSELAKQMASLDLQGLKRTSQSVLLKVIDKSGMLKLVGDFMMPIMETIMGDGGLKSIIKMGAEQIIKKRLGESFGADLDLLMADPAMMMERMLQRGKFSNNVIFRTISKLQAQSVNTSISSEQRRQDPRAKANFDVAAHTALTHVIPHKLDKIYAAFTGTQMETFNYNENKWMKVEELASMYNNKRPDNDVNIVDVLSKIQDLMDDGKMKQYASDDGKFLYGDIFSRLINALADKGGDLKGLVTANPNEVAKQLDLTPMQARVALDVIRTMMADKDGNEVIASADRDIQEKMQDIKNWSNELESVYSQYKILQNNALANMPLAPGDNIMASIKGVTSVKGGGILGSLNSAIASVEGFGDVMKVYVVNGIAGGGSKTMRNSNAKLDNTSIPFTFDQAAGKEGIYKGSRFEPDNYVYKFNTVKGKEHTENDINSRKGRDSAFLKDFTAKWNKTNGTNYTEEDITMMNNVYNYMRATGVGRSEMLEMFAGLGSKTNQSYKEFSDEYRENMTTPRNWYDVNLDWISDDMKHRAKVYSEKGSMTDKGFSLEDPIESTIGMLRDLYKNPNLVNKIHGGTGMAMGGVVGSILGKVTGIGGIYAPIVGSILGGAASMSTSFQNISNQLLGEHGEDDMGGAKRKQRVLEKIFQQVLPSVIGGSVAGKFVGKVIGKFMPYGAILGPLGALVTGALTGTLLYQSNIISRSLGDTKFGRIMTSIPVIGKYFKVRKGEAENESRSTDASFRDLFYGGMSKDKEGNYTFNDDVTDKTTGEYEEFQNIMSEFRDELEALEEEKADNADDIESYLQALAEIEGSSATPAEKSEMRAKLKAEYSNVLSRQKRLVELGAKVGNKYKAKLKASGSRFKASDIDSMIDNAVARGYMSGSRQGFKRKGSKFLGKLKSMGSAIDRKSVV